MLTRKRAREVFRYVKRSGKLYWKVKLALRINIGDEAGGIVNCRGKLYRHVRVDGRKYLTHRIIWLMVHGCWPTGELDHEDGDGLNNRLCNLRDVTHMVNSQNERCRNNNTSGCTGVSYHGERWRAQICVSYKVRHLGLFDSFKEAVRARKRAEAEYGFHRNHGREALLAC